MKFPTKMEKLYNTKLLFVYFTSKLLKSFKTRCLVSTKCLIRNYKLVILIILGFLFLEGVKEGINGINNMGSVLK